jgi:hypothetical protein
VDASPSDLCLDGVAPIVRSEQAGAGIAVLARLDLEHLMLMGAVILGSLITHRQWKMTAIAAAVAFVLVTP